jgi:hypothetical protein
MTILRQFRVIKMKEYVCYIDTVALGGPMVACLPLNPKFVGSNPAENDGFLRAIKIRSTTSF